MSMGTLSLSESVAAEIRALMARRMMTQAELAEKIGVSEMWVSRKARGRQVIDLDDLQRIADALDVAVVDLLPTTASDRPTAPRPVELADDRLAAHGRPLGRRKRTNGGYPRTTNQTTRHHPTRPPTAPGPTAPSPDRPRLTRAPAAAA